MRKVLIKTFKELRRIFTAPFLALIFTFLSVFECFEKYGAEKFLSQPFAFYMAILFTFIVALFLFNSLFLFLRSFKNAKVFCMLARKIKKFVC